MKTLDKEKVTPKFEKFNIENSNLVLQPKDIADYIPKWLINGFAEKHKLISLYAMPGQGKSITTLYLACYILENKLINKIIYIDMDNGLGTLKSRGLERLLIKYGESLKYISTSKKATQDFIYSEVIRKLSENASDSNNDTLIIFDSIRNFIKGSMSVDNDVMPTLNAMQKMRNYYAGVWFLNHQSKQDFTGENNKAYKGATAFFDSCDEAYFVKKISRTDNRLITTLEPMKQRDDTQPQAIIIDTDNLSIKFEDFILHSLNEKQSQALEYIKEVILDHPNGITQTDLLKRVKRLSATDETEICGANSMLKLLNHFAGKLYRISTGNIRNSCIYYPLT
ncbi:AAA family ATPase [Campylobacter jejuni]|uniref:AAA family ATPase n=1 Tax=Campylobacter jejuni TaxID=197 RepID=UPI00069BE046|nr:AAA family ATPase [Campylobacter jejuni]